MNRESISNIVINFKNKFLYFVSLFIIKHLFMMQNVK